MRNVEPGFRVMGSDGEEIGTIANCSRQFCEVTTGILGLGGVLYVPMDAISQTEGDTVYLNVSSERISELNWSEPPEGSRETCPTGFYGTMPAEQAQPSSSLSPGALESVGHGWDIICSEGKKVGTVASARPDGLVMERGWFIFRHTSLVPATTIARIDDIRHRVDLAVDCAAVNQFRSV